MLTEEMWKCAAVAACDSKNRFSLEMDCQIKSPKMLNTLKILGNSICYAIG